MLVYIQYDIWRNNLQVRPLFMSQSNLHFTKVAFTCLKLSMLFIHLAIVRSPVSDITFDAIELELVFWKTPTISKKTARAINLFEITC